MNELLLIIEIVVVFSIVLLAKRFFGKEGLMLWMGIASILANLEVAKMIDIFGFSATLGNVLFASTFLATDILSECYGKEYAKKGVYMGLFSVIIYLITTQFALLFQPSSVDIMDSSMKMLFGLAPRVCFMSLLMYFIANRIDVYLYDKLKEKFKGKKMWLRNNVCTIACNCIENFGFNMLAFGGILPLKELIIVSASTCVLEVIIALCDTPFLYLSKKIK